jgi:raffinose/stachyose/melibiose transport system permease protein
VTSQFERVFTYGILLLASVYALYPLLSIVFLAFQEPGSLSTGLEIPTDPSFEAFRRAWVEGGFDHALLSSFIITASVVVASVFLSILTGYAFGTMRFRGSGVLFAFLLFGVVVPWESTVYPLYYDYQRVGLTDTYFAVILPEIGLSVAFGTFWLRAFFRSAPRQLMDAARVDGASSWTVLWRILVPIGRPAIVTLTILLFVFTWNDFLLSLVMIQNEDTWTAPVALASFAGRQYDTGELREIVAAASVLVALPIVLIYIVLQRQFMRGLLTGSVKE